jgi:N-acetylmuramoyl-L-alanine amidase
VLLQVTGRHDSFLSVMTPCEASGWVSASQVEMHKKDTEPATSLKGATIVLDPGHGGQLPGALGPGGYTEKEANLDIAKRLAPKLEGARVFLTRTGDYTAGLPFRAGLANNLGADLLVSIHNNAAPDGPSDKPGTETYYQRISASSKRLAGILYEEVFRVLEPVKLSWMSDEDAGAKYRTNVRGEDFYGILRRTKVPAVIVEAMFISNAPEENLLRTDEAREGIAGALAKGIRRYLETEDQGSGFVEPLNRNAGSSGQLPSVCMEPT